MLYSLSWDIRRSKKKEKRDPEGACKGRLCSIPGGYHSKEEAADGT